MVHALSLMSKGERIVEEVCFFINDKGGDCCKFEFVWLSLMSNLVVWMESCLVLILYCWRFLCLVFGVAVEFDVLVLAVASSKSFKCMQ